MGFTEKTGMYRRHTHLWHILTGLASLLVAYFILGGDSRETASQDGPFIFGSCVINAVVFLFAFAFNFGMTMWVTFVAGIVMFKNLPTHTFGHIQSKLFPFYFLIGAVTGFMMLVIAVHTSMNLTQLTCEQKTVLGALASIFLPNLLNGIFVGPWSTAIMFERHRMEKEVSDKSELEGNAEYKALNKSFGKMHGVSSLLNLVSLGGACYILYWLSSLIIKLSVVQSM